MRPRTRRNEITRSNVGRRPVAAAVLEPFVSPRRILFASVAGGRPTAALRRAAALAELVGAELHVLRVLPFALRCHMLFPERHVTDALAVDRLELTLARRTRRWCTTALTRALPADRVRIREGELSAAVVACAAEIGCELVVLPAREGRDGAMVTRIASAAHLPVLVARRSTASEGVVVATDLADPRYPLLHHGVDLAARLEAPVTFVHNVPPLPPEVPMAFGMSVPVSDAGSSESLMARQMERLREQARRVCPSAETVVLSRPSTIQAILEVSREREADLVVVGTRARSWLRRLAAPSVARRVVEKASRSVLVIPMGERAPQTTGVES